MKDKFKRERELFENWVLSQFQDFDETPLKTNKKLEYIDDHVSMLFVGFCGGYTLAKQLQL